MLPFLLLLSCAAPAQTTLEHIAFIPSTQADQLLGDSFTDLGDINNDGIADFAVGSPTFQPASGLGSGLVQVFSGADRSLLYAIHPTAGVDNLLGKTLTTIGDVNQDGVLDFVIGCGWSAPAYMVSGIDGVRLTSIDTGSNGQFGMQIKSIGDLNGDALPEFAIGLPNETVAGNSSAGRIMIMNGATGLLIQEISGSSSFRWMGKSLCGPGDLNGDGVPDLLVNGADGSAFHSDGLTAISGADFQPLYMRTRSDMRQRVIDFAALGDVNGDSVNDFLITGYQDNTAEDWMQGVTRIVSGSDGSSLKKIVGAKYEEFGRTVTTLGDVDGDGVIDFSTTAFHLNRGWQTRPVIEVFSGATGAKIGSAQTPSFNYFTVRAFALSDIDNDGRDEIVIGIPEHQVGATPNGYLPGGELHIFGHKL
jgi:hypothetical protein